jgi:Zn-dependent protease
MSFGGWRYRVRLGPSRARNELIDLLLSWGALTVAFGAGSILRKDMNGLLVSAIAVATAFVFHELAHRFVARRFGMYARYQAWYTGLALAVFIALITAKLGGHPFVLAAPGAVVVSTLWGYVDPVVELYVAAAGPASNIIVAIASLLISLFVPYPFHYYIRFIGVVNAWIAVFNLLPIPPFDGSKVMKYSLRIWVILFALSVTIWVVL